MKIKASIVISRAKERLASITKEISDRKDRHDDLLKKTRDAKRALNAAELHFLRRLAANPGDALIGVVDSYQVSLAFKPEKLPNPAKTALETASLAKTAHLALQQDLQRAKIDMTPEVVGHGKSAGPNGAMRLVQDSRHLTELIATLKAVGTDQDIQLSQKNLATVFPEFS